MFRPTRRALPFVAACLAAGNFPVRAQIVTPPTGPDTNIFDPQRAPEIVLHVGVRRIVLVPHPSGSSTTLSAKAIENKANSSSFSSIIASSVPGAAASSSGELHIRGSHGQYTYYLDGAPLPESVSGSFSDLIDPKNIETLRVYTGGFPAQYGNNIAAVFDVTAKAGRVGRPGGLIQQIAQGYQTFETTAQAGGRSQDFSYFVSGVHSSTNRKLDPVSQDPLHDAGNDAVVFGKFDYTAGPHDRIVLDTAHTDAWLQIPNAPDRQALGQDDTQRENGSFANLIWRRDLPKSNFVLAFYSHKSRLRYAGSPADLVGATADNPLTSTIEDRTANDLGVRLDSNTKLNAHHKIGVGFDVSTLTGQEQFKLDTSTGVGPIQSITDNHDISGGDRAVYLQDDWTPSKPWLINFGARYDIHKTDATYYQLSPRVNVTYTAGPHDKLHAYYDHLFQPAPIEDVRRLVGSSAVGDASVSSIKPEKDNFYEVGWQHDQSNITTSLSAYYKTAKDVIDESPVGASQITVPFNVEKGYVRGLEFAIEGPVTPSLSAYANYARAWAQSAGAITGGLLSDDSSSAYFPVDHDQTHTASVGFEYDHHGITASLDGEYGSGFPYEDDSGIFRRVAPHFIFNSALGTRLGTGQVTLTVNNLLNHPYVIKQAGTFTNQEWGQARTFGIKFTQNF